MTMRVVEDSLLCSLPIKVVRTVGEWKDIDLCTWHSLSNLIHPQLKDKVVFILQKETEA